jgi:hypothetical protein
MSNKAKVVKMCDMTGDIAARVFEMLNHVRVVGKKNDVFISTVIVTDVEPKDLIYPEGWYYAKGRLRNKHNSTTGVYNEVIMRKKDGTLWGDLAKYCTQD